MCISPASAAFDFGRSSPRANGFGAAFGKNVLSDSKMIISVSPDNDSAPHVPWQNTYIPSNKLLRSIDTVWMHFFPLFLFFAVNAARGRSTCCFFVSSNFIQPI